MHSKLLSRRQAEMISKTMVILHIIGARIHVEVRCAKTGRNIHVVEEADGYITVGYGEHEPQDLWRKIEHYDGLLSFCMDYQLDTLSGTACAGSA